MALDGGYGFDMVQRRDHLTPTDLGIALDPNPYPGPAGDAGEGLDVPVVLSGGASQGKGETYTPLPGVLPTKDHLDYVQKLSTAGLLTFGFVLLVVLAILNPHRAFGFLARGAQRQAGL